MLTINNKEIDYSSEVGNEIKRLLDEIENDECETTTFMDSRLKAPMRQKVYNEKGEVAGNAEMGFIAIPNIDKFIFKGIGYNIGYSSSSPSIKDGYVFIKKEKIYFQNVLVLDNKHDKEKIFYLKYVSSITKSDIYVYNEDKEMDTRINVLLGDTEIKYNIFVLLSKEKIGSEEPLRLLASSWNISGAEKMKYMKLQESLYNAVIYSEKKKIETKRGYKEFISEASKVINGKSAEIEKRANIQKAIDHSILSFEDGSRYIFMKGSPIETEVVRVRPSDLGHKFDKLVNVINPEMYDMILTELNGDMTSDEEVDGDIFKGKGHMAVRGMARSRGIPAAGDVEEVKKRILEFEEKNK